MKKNISADELAQFIYDHWFVLSGDTREDAMASFCKPWESDIVSRLVVNHCVSANDVETKVKELFTKG